MKKNIANGSTRQSSDIAKVSPVAIVKTPLPFRNSQIFLMFFIRLLPQGKPLESSALFGVGKGFQVQREAISIHRIWRQLSPLTNA